MYEEKNHIPDQNPLVTFHLIANRIKVLRMAYKVLHGMNPSISFPSVATLSGWSVVLILSSLFLDYSRCTWYIVLALPCILDVLHLDTHIVSPLLLSSLSSNISLPGKPSFAALSIHPTFPHLTSLLCPYHHLLYYDFIPWFVSHCQIILGIDGT